MNDALKNSVSASNIFKRFPIIAVYLCNFQYIISIEVYLVFTEVCFSICVTAICNKQFLTVANVML